MRITRLLLARYGHLSDVDLIFDPKIPLHIVLGANEAGKSTALAAIEDALFGFPHRTPFAFLHKTTDLRLGIGMRAADGREGFFLRRKGRPDKLSDAQDSPLPDSAIAAFLAGAAREKFTEVFGMDGAGLRRGGKALLEEKGEIGQSIVQAHTGLHNVRTALSRLNDAALELYGDRRGGRAFHIAKEAFVTAKHDVETRSVRPAEYDQASKDRSETLQIRARNAAESALLEGERARLDRIRRTTPARLALQHARTARAALGDIPSLPADAGARRSNAIQSLTILNLDFSRERQSQAEAEASLLAISVDEALLGEANAIDALAADLNRIESAARDRETQGQEAAQARRRVEETGTRLGSSLDADTLIARLPGAFLRVEAERALTEHTRLQTRQRESAAALEQAESAVANAKHDFAALSEPAKTETLAAAIEAAKAEGRIDTDVAEAEDALTAAHTALSQALANLPLWQNSAEDLARTTTPLAASLAEGEAALAAAHKNLQARQADSKNLQQALRAVEADLAGVLAAGIPPTAEAIAIARARRDRAWRLIRTQFVEGGPPPSAAELADLPTPLADTLAGLITEADSLADRRTAEAERVAAYEQCAATQARTQALHTAATAALQATYAEAQAAQAAWEAIWRPLGITPGDPAQMREWLTRRQTVLTFLEDTAAKSRGLARIKSRRQAVRQGLVAVLPAFSENGGADIAPLLHAAALRLQHLEAAQIQHAEAKRALAEKERALAEQQRKQELLGTQLKTWQQAWAPLAGALGLPPQAGAKAGAESLSVWADIDRHAQAMKIAQGRIRDMTSHIETFTARVAEICKNCAPDLATQAPIAAVRALATRLALNRSAAADRAKLLQAIGARQQVLQSLTEKIAKAEADLAGLRALAGVQTDEALQAAIARADEAATLARQIAEREAELRRLDDGLTLEELAREAEGEAPDLLPARISELESRRNDIAAENEFLASRLRDLETRIHAMERGQEAAEAAQRMQDAAAEAEEIAARYVRLRLSHTLLRAGIDRFRREQQAPLLAAAGALFASLTQGRYESLDIKEAEDQKMIVVGLRPDGTACPADRLSEGTRDQLYLALRLAGIRTHAAQAEPLPFIADDLLASFDDIRAKATLNVLAEFGEVTQTILFTHHGHIADMADPLTMRVHRLG